MLSRRLFLASTGLALGAGRTLAQAAPAIEDPGPLRLSIAPEAIDATLSLPPDVEGDYVIPERLRARVVQVAPGLTPGDIHIVSQSFNLYFVLPGDTAIRYGVAIGQEGLGWRGQATIGRKVEWPSWRPTDEMIARNPARYARYADGMPGGPDNPLGTPRALLLPRRARHRDPHPRHARARLDRRAGLERLLPHVQQPRRGPL
jgi:lipoprotein-anchoring transpeptidase ErfK/SrfK